MLTAFKSYFVDEINMSNEQQARRQHERRAIDTCVTEIEDRVYPVENWSHGGVLISGDSRYIGNDNVYDVTLRFKLRDRVLNVKQPARVVRQAGHKTAFQFMPLAEGTHKAFQQVIDDMVAGQFANSQA
jgi:hypothetical protein